MACAKFGVLFICILFVCQVVTPSPLAENVQDNDLAKEVKKIIVSVTNLLETVIDELYKVTSILSKDGLDNLQKQSVSFTLKVFDGVKKIIDKELDRIQPQLNNDAKIISKCLESNGEEIIKIIIDYYNWTSICFIPTVKPLMASLEPLLVDLKKVDTSVANLAPQLDKCGNNICVLGVIQLVVKQLGVLPDVVKKDLPAIETSLKTFVTSAITCANKEVDPWEKESYEIFNKVATCYNK